VEDHCTDASLVASCAAGVRRLALERITALHTAALIATFGCDAPARGGAFADERRDVSGGEADGRAHPWLGRLA
jgi:hypothetical protein